MTTTATGPSSDAGEEGPPPAGRNTTHWRRELIVVLSAAIVVAVLLRVFVVGTFSIPTPSMEPTLVVGDRIVVDKLSYELHGVHRGDIVVFARPAHEDCAGPPVPDLVKRIIGLPGETISLTGHGYVLINGKRLHETWLPSSKQGTTYAGPSGTTYSLDHPYKIPADHFFVMGDNRGISCDSRYWGPIAGSSIVGRVDLSFWPLSALHIF